MQHLAQQRLIHAEKMRALGELAGGMAHEFNNSLCGTLGFLELALRSPSPDPVTRGYLESARTSEKEDMAAGFRTQSLPIQDKIIKELEEMLARLQRNEQAKS